MLAHKENGKWGPLRTEENVRRREGRAGREKKRFGEKKQGHKGKSLRRGERMS
jgi:hypothetical protein